MNLNQDNKHPEGSAEYWKAKYEDSQSRINKLLIECSKLLGEKLILKMELSFQKLVNEKLNKDSRKQNEEVMAEVEKVYANLRELGFNTLRVSRSENKSDH